MTKGRWVLVVLLGIGGLAVIGWGWRLSSGDGFAPSVLLELGAGLLLFAVLFFIERTILQRLSEVRHETVSSIDEISGRVEQMRVDTDRTKARLEELGDVTQAALEKRNAEFDGSFAAFEDDVSLQTTRAIISAAVSLDCIDPDGVRVEIPHTYLRLRFASRSLLSGVPDGEPMQEHVEAIIERLSGAELGRVQWFENTSVEDFIINVAAELQKLGEFNPGFDGQAIFARLKSTLQTAVNARTRWGATPMDLGKVVEIPNQQWAVTTYGVECLDHFYPIEGSRIWEDDWHPHMREKAWVDFEAFWEALEIAKALNPLPTPPP